MSWRSSENLRRIGGTALYTLTESDSFPFILDKKGTGLLISNNDSSVNLIIKVYRKNDNIDFRIKNTLNVPVSPFDKIDIVQATSSFDIIVVNPEGE